MLFDTDVLIWIFRGSLRAARVVQDEAERLVSVVTYMELVQGARNKAEWHTIKRFLTELAFQVLPLTENIGHRACIYVEEYGFRSGMSIADSLIAATATESGVVLCTSDAKHYRPIGELQLNLFRP